jgi:protein SCO1/2
LPDVCPTDLLQIALAVDQLGEAGEMVQPVFITVDPERDTPAELKDYLSGFNPRFKGLTGDTAAIAQVAKSYRVYLKKVPLDNGDYTMDHTALVYLMDKNGKFVAPFNLKRRPEDAAADLRPYL